MATRLIALLALIAISFTSCAMTQRPLPPANSLVVPEPVEGNGGKYMCPYTSDGTVAPWVKTALSSSAFSSIGSAVGGFALSRATSAIPFIGGLIGSEIGSRIGKEVAIEAAGGWTKIKQSSDLSFQRAGDMAIYVYAKHSKHQDYGKVVSATSEIYDDFAAAYPSALYTAKRKRGAVKNRR